MHNEHYLQLQEQSCQNPRKLGVSLPAMTTAQLKLISNRCSAAQICEQVEQLQATEGWLMYRDTLELTSQAPVRYDFVEGEWCNQHTSLKVKHLNGDTYLCVTMSLSEEKTVAQQYKEQVIYLRKDLKADQQNAVIYRQWFEQGTSGDSEGRWLPLMQQFVGFTQAKTTQHAATEESL